MKKRLAYVSAEEGTACGPFKRLFENFRCDGGRCAFAVASGYCGDGAGTALKKKLDFACEYASARDGVGEFGKIGTKSRRTEDYFLVYPAEIIFTENKTGAERTELFGALAELFF